MCVWKQQQSTLSSDVIPILSYILFLPDSMQGEHTSVVYAALNEIAFINLCFVVEKEKEQGLRCHLDEEEQEDM